MSSDLSLQGIEGQSIFDLDTEWDHLVSVSNSSFYQSRKWCEPWWRHYADSSRVGAAVVRDNEGVALGLGLMSEMRVPVIGCLNMGVRTSLPLGSFAGSPDHLGVLHVPGSNRAEVVRMIIEWMKVWGRGKPFLVPSFADASIEAGSLGDVPCVSRATCPRAITQPGSTWEQVRSGWSKNRRKKLRQKTDVFFQAGGHFEWFVDPGEVLEALDIVQELHRQRWTSREYRTQFGWDRTRREFLRSVIRADGPGVVWAQLASIAGKGVGGLFGFALGGRLHVYQSGWDPNFAQLSIGLIQYAEAFRRSVDGGYTEFDMCRGVDAYKMRFATDVVHESTYLDSRTFPGHLLKVSSRRWSKTPSPAIPESENYE